MKLYFEDYSEGKLDLRSEVYNSLSDIYYKYAKEGAKRDHLNKSMDEAIKWFQIKFFDDDVDFGAAINEGKDLSKVDGTIANIFEKEYARLMKIEDVNSLREEVIKLFKDNGIDTKYSRNMIKAMYTKRSLLALQEYITNVWLAGSDLATIK